ncbi:MAG: hypothetical protein J6D47_15755 [Peptostreptococcaceae bacterium]|nr:hypothetical protein [Peptostreptococcaceae bacterium]
MNKDLLKLKRILNRINEPTREELICKALRTIFNDEQVGLTDKEAFNVLGWNYNSKEELFTIHNKNNLKVTPYEKHESIIFNTNTEKEIDGIDGAIVLNLGRPQKEQ